MVAKILGVSVTSALLFLIQGVVACGSNDDSSSGALSDDGGGIGSGGSSTGGSAASTGGATATGGTAGSTGGTTASGGANPAGGTGGTATGSGGTTSVGDASTGAAECSPDDLSACSVPDAGGFFADVTACCTDQSTCGLEFMSPQGPVCFDPDNFGGGGMDAAAVATCTETDLSNCTGMSPCCTPFGTCGTETSFGMNTFCVSQGGGFGGP